MPIEPIFNVPDLQQRGAYPFGSATASASGVLIFRPGAPAGSPSNVFADWPTLYAATLPGALVQVDTSLVSPAVIPPGDWSANVFALYGNPDNPDASGFTTLHVDDGAILRTPTQGVAVLAQGLALTTLGTAPAFTLGPGGTLRLQTGATLNKDPAALGPAVLCEPGAALTTAPIAFVLDFLTELGPTADTVEVSPTVPVGASLVYLYANGGTVDSGTFVGGGPNLAAAVLVLVFVSNTSFLASANPITMPGIAQFVSENFTDEAPLPFIVSQVPAGVAPVNAVIPYLRSPTSAPPGDATVRSFGATELRAGLKVDFYVEHTGDGSASGNVATYEILKNGASLVPPVKIVLPADGGTVHGNAGFAGWHTFLDFWSLKVTTTILLAAPGITNVTGMLSP